MEYLSKGMQTYGAYLGKNLFFGFLLMAFREIPTLQILVFAWFPLKIAILFNLLLVVVAIISSLLVANFAYVALIMVRRRPLNMKDFFHCFSSCQRFIQFFSVGIFYNLLVFLWFLLLIIPGIIKSLGYFMSFYIVTEDQSEDPCESLGKSQVMMQGQKCRLFLLMVVFMIPFILILGLYFLTKEQLLLTIGNAIIMIFVCPLVFITFGHFYENLREQEDEQIYDEIQGEGISNPSFD